MRFVCLVLVLFCGTSGLSAQDRPNILLVIADDLGVDRLRGYHDGNLMATTPTLDSLRAAGITFTNATAQPACSPTRAQIMSGKYGVKTGVLTVPGNLDPAQGSLFEELNATTGGSYAHALIGKWHLTSPAGPTDPGSFGMDHFDGFLRGAPDDYYDWARTRNEMTTTETGYVTTVLTDAALEWIDGQTDPWFLWLAHAAPHSPYHVPPDGTYSIPTTGNNTRQYVAMVEALDFELGRMLGSLDAATRKNTVVIFVGDNGTPNNVMQDYPDGHGKSSLYQGGLRVPLIVAGKGVSRVGEREAALVHVSDLHATVLELAGAELPGGRFNSLGFRDLLGENAATAVTRDYNYADKDDLWAIRNARYKLIQRPNGGQEMYDLLLDSFEVNNLLVGQPGAEILAVGSDLALEAQTIREGWSCRDHIQNGNETGVDCGTDACGVCTTSTAEADAVLLSIFPNPASAFVVVRARTPVRGEVLVSDGAGRVYSRPVVDNRVDIADLPAGVYWLEFNVDGRRVGRKLVKQ